MWSLLLLSDHCFLALFRGKLKSVPRYLCCRTVHLHLHFNNTITKELVKCIMKLEFSFIKITFIWFYLQLARSKGESNARSRQELQL